MLEDRPIIELVHIDISRFDELDVARCVSKLGGSMRGRIASFSNHRDLAAAWDILCEKFGSRYFAIPQQVAA